MKIGEEHLRRQQLAKKLNLPKPSAEEVSKLVNDYVAGGGQITYGKYQGSYFLD